VRGRKGRDGVVEGKIRGEERKGSGRRTSVA